MKKISNLFRLNTVFDPSTHRAELCYSHVDIDIHIVIPNHFHGIVIINEEWAQHAEPLQQIKIQPLGVIVRSFKSAVTKSARDLCLFVGEKIWQRNYYEHIIRDEDDYQQIVDYIASNPFNWNFDHENPENI